jgi:hypothetical protein
MKNCKVLILVLAGNTYRSNSNLKTQTNTWMKHVNHDVKIISYKGGGKENFKGNVLQVNVNDKYQNISEKTLEAFKWINRNYNFDYLFRTNTSSYVDLKNLENFCDLNQNKFLYRGRRLENVFNQKSISWVSGAEILLSKDTFNILVDNFDTWDISLPDDVAIGSILQNKKVLISESKSLLFSPSFFHLRKFEHEYHFRCRVDSPYYYPRILDKVLMYYINSELYSLSISTFKRTLMKGLFLCSKIFAFQKHKDYLSFYFWKFIKKLFSINN